MASRDSSAEQFTQLQQRIGSLEHQQPIPLPPPPTSDASAAAAAMMIQQRKQLETKHRQSCIWTVGRQYHPQCCIKNNLQQSITISYPWLVTRPYIQRKISYCRDCWHREQLITDPLCVSVESTSTTRSVIYNLRGGEYVSPCCTR